MKNSLLSLLVLFLFSACGVKQTRVMLASGNYDDAIKNAVYSLRGDKNSKGKQDYVYILEEAFAKAKERDVRNITTLFKDANPNNLDIIYDTYVQLNERQELIRPLLPLKLIKEGRDAIFPFDDYSDEIVNSKNVLSKYLYESSKAQLSSNNKASIRSAYDDLMRIESINPGYRDIGALMAEAKAKGTDYVYVSTANETNVIIPARLENDLLNFNTYGLNDSWTVYHGSRQKNLTYDYEMVLNFRQINISPEQIKEKQFEKEKEIKDGTKPVLDERGNIKRDNQGNPLKVDNLKKVTISIYEIAQIKSCQIVAQVDVKNNHTKQLINTFPLSSEFVFSNIYSSYKGDRKACEESYYPNFDRKIMPFPSNEQMVYDAGQDVKAKLKDIIVKNKLRS